MRLRSLESRIVILFLLLILAIQLAGFFAIRASIERNARASISDELAIGERVFQRLLKQNAETLTQGARLLAADYGFRNAIASDDVATISSALANHGARIGATLTVLIGLDHTIRVAATETPLPSLENAILPLVDSAEQTGDAAGIAIIDNHAFQIVVLPVKAPITMGWVAMAFPIDSRLAADMRELSSLQVSILTHKSGASWVPGVSTLNEVELKTLTRHLQESASDNPLPIMQRLDDNEFSTRVFRLAQDSGQTSIVVLQRSIMEAIAPYRQLQLTLLLLTGLGIVLAVAGSILTAKRITGPLRQLTDSARRLGSGDYYQGTIKIQQADEIGELSNAFDNMRESIANRELEIRRLAYWDSLTNLPNRAQFVTLLDNALVHARRYRQSCHVLMMDLDRFKHVNDVLGHSFGDALLVQVAQRLLALKLKGSDQVARLGGDEFAILLPDSQLEEAQAIAACILESLETPISLDDQTVDLGASIGIAGFPAHGSDAESLLSRVDVAMYAAKNSGNTAVVYDPAIDKTSQESLSLLGELRRAIDNDEFRIYVQPKVALDTGEVTGVEALIRWMHPKRGLIQPDDFIPFAEKTGVIRALTRWMLEQAAALCHHWKAHGVQLKISVNLSTRDLLDQDLPAKFVEILLRHQVASSSFCLEITESTIMDDPVRAQQTLERLYAIGCELSIDDFGTGYSSLAYLKRLPVHELKIDKSFVMNMEHEVDDATIVRSTIDLGHNMGLRVVAEGVESQTAWGLLARMGCDRGQGYFISKPMPAEQFLHWIKNWSAPPLAQYESMI